MLRKLIHFVILCAPAYMPCQVCTHEYMKHAISELVEQFVLYTVELSTVHTREHTSLCYTVVLCTYKGTH